MLDGDDGTRADKGPFLLSLVTHAIWEGPRRTAQGFGLGLKVKAQQHPHALLFILRPATAVLLRTGRRWWGTGAEAGGLSADRPAQ